MTLLGTRKVNADGSFGEYEWLTYQQVVDLVTDIGLSIRIHFPFLKYQDPICVFGKNSMELEVSIFGGFFQVFFYYI